MDEPDLFTWLQHWRCNTGHEAQAAQAMPQVEPLALQVGDAWMALSTTQQPDVIRVDVLIEPVLEHEVAPWICEELLRWSFGHPYLSDGLQFALDPDGALVACAQLAIEPGMEAPAVEELLMETAEQINEAWTLIMADALLQAYLAQQPPTAVQGSLAV
ncbi:MULTISPECIES: hypothetical protein [Hydrogenophaga]|jgi:hypothetical protein|uniref:Uncharacterized protein n=1 Tax=Hydrogenophaga intermedia TaxID=65786 RepID=A0A1L1PDB2_HYDIT|nr:MULTISPECIES: hypothetical protein [Hydrogenophaga]AOS79876.1 hypothetical protein Q5W_13330 [Hydrogenophaga sp. PBC]TMU75514.1 hypothetical protein FGJ01_10350 [Hydrogenophaga intermedia]CDN87988.1 hypothetical protein BN948_02418 [Hydrogenophaga intermedia]